MRRLHFIGRMEGVACGYSWEGSGGFSAGCGLGEFLGLAGFLERASEFLYPMFLGLIAFAGVVNVACILTKRGFER